MIPLGDWLRRDLRPALDDLLAPECVRMRGLFDVDTVETMKSEHLTGARTHADRLWTLMMAEQWMRAYLDQRGRWSLRRGAHERPAPSPHGLRPVAAAPGGLRRTDALGARPAPRR